MNFNFNELFEKISFNEFIVFYTKYKTNKFEIYL